MGVRRVWVVVAALSLTACGGGGSESPTPAARPSSTAQITISSPADGSTVQGPTVSVSFDLTGAEITQETSTNLVPDKGHVHVFLDDMLVGMNYQLDGTIPNVAPGTHVLRVEFVALDHGSFNPPVFAQVAFEVKA
jgi:hypothetical protein